MSYTEKTSPTEYATKFPFFGPAEWAILKKLVQQNMPQNSLYFGKKMKNRRFLAEKRSIETRWNISQLTWLSWETFHQT